MHYLVVMKGTGEGCDYTIGCNIKVCQYEAADREALLKKIVKEYGGEEYNPEASCCIDTLEIFQVAGRSEKIDAGVLFADSVAESKRRAKDREVARLKSKLAALEKED